MSDTNDTSATPDDGNVEVTTYGDNSGDPRTLTALIQIEHLRALRYHLERQLDLCPNGDALSALYRTQLSIVNAKIAARIAESQESPEPQ